MKKITKAISLFAFALVAGDAMGESAADIGTLPSQKVPASIDVGDRNPFGTRIAVQEQDLGNFDSESEESRIRQVFATLQVTGRSGGRVLVGDLILEEGKDVPQVIDNQTDILRVTRITDKEVELTWIDEEVAEAPRKLPISIQLEPEVSFVLPGRGNQPSTQFVTMSNAEDAAREKEAAARRGGALGGDEEDEDEDPDGDDTTQPGNRNQPAQAKKVSPFGLFRR